MIAGAPPGRPRREMRLLFVLPYLPSRIRVRPYQFIRQLSRRNDVSVLATDSRPRLRPDAGLVDCCERTDVVPFRISAAARSCFGAALVGEPLQSAVCHSPELTHRLRELVATDQFDVVHLEHLRSGRLGAAIPLEQPTLFDAVDSISLLLARTLRSSHSVRQRILAAIELRRTRAYEARLLTRFDHTIVTSSDDAQALRRLAPDSAVSVVRNGVDLEYFKPMAGLREAATLVFSGKMSYHANVTAVLHFVRRILPLVRAERPDVRLWIVGSDPPATVRALATDRSITVTGYVPDIRGYLARASVSICPVTVKVGIQNKVLEAMAMSAPVVASAEGAAGLAARHGRDLLVAHEPQEFAAQVCQLLADAGLAATLAVAGRRYVERHHRWETAAQTLEALYQEVIAHHATADRLKW
jgi:polysaccharide biosynthesis protein PslH